MSDTLDESSKGPKRFTRAELLRTGLTFMGGAVAQKIDRTIPDVVKNVRTPIYPPGAVAEFTSRCTSCGDCVEACPVDALVAVPSGTNAKPLPVVIPVKAACTMCEDTPCITSCSDGALIRGEGEAFPVMGTAVIDLSTCLAYNGSTCYACYDACPLKRKAIRLKATRPEIDASECTGCGLCEHACVTEQPKAIRVMGARPGTS